MASEKKRPTRKEFAERITFARSLLTRCCTLSTVKAAFRKTYGPTHHRTILDYVVRARRQMMADAARGRRLLQAESQCYYESVVADPSSHPRLRMLARERLDKLLGLEDRTPPDALEDLLGRLPADVAGALREALGRQLAGAAGRGGEPAEGPG